MTLWVWPASRLTPSILPLRLTVALGTGAPFGTLARQYGNAVVISPDGTLIAFVAQPKPDDPPRLFVRQLR